MKKTGLMLLLLCGLSAATFAQREETLFSYGGGLTGAWGGVIYNYSYFDEDWTYIRGGYGGLEFGRSVFLGIGNFRTRENVNLEGLNIPFRMKYGGFLLGLAPNAYKAVHPRINILMGRGRIDMTDGDTDRVFVMQPSAGLEINVFQWFRLGLEGGYRFTMDTDLPLLENQDVSTPFAQIDLKFGFSWGR